MYSKARLVFAQVAGGHLVHLVNGIGRRGSDALVVAVDKANTY